MAENNNNAVKKNKAMRFFRETKSEMKKVSWPSKEQLIHNTLVILAFIALTTVILSLLDAGFERLLTFIVK